MIRAFLISTTIIALTLTAGIIISHACVDSCEDMLAIVESLPMSNADVKEEDISRLRSIMKNTEPLFSLSLKKDYASNISLCLDNLALCSLCGTQSEYLYAKASLSQALNTALGAEGLGITSFI